MAYSVYLPEIWYYNGIVDNILWINATTITSRFTNLNVIFS